MIPFKMWVANPDQSKRVQEILFSLGESWHHSVPYCNRKKVLHTSCHYLKWNSIDGIVGTDDPFIHAGHEEPPITYEDFINKYDPDSILKFVQEHPEAKDALKQVYPALFKKPIDLWKLPQDEEGYIFKRDIDWAECGLEKTDWLIRVHNNNTLSLDGDYNYELVDGGEFKFLTISEKCNS